MALKQKLIEDKSKKQNQMMKVEDKMKYIKQVSDKQLYNQKKEQERLDRKKAHIEKEALLKKRRHEALLADNERRQKKKAEREAASSIPKKRLNTGGIVTPKKQHNKEERKVAKPTSNQQTAANVQWDSVEHISYANKDHLLAEFCIRWWYALPEPWPPVNYDYTAKLKERNLRKVDQQRFKQEPELDAEGRKKVYEIEYFNGYFRDSSNVIHDLRPMETCPSQNNFAKKEKADLQKLLMKAYEEQLQELYNLTKKHSQYDRYQERDLIKCLQTKIKRLSRYAPPEGKLHLEPISAFTDV